MISSVANETTARKRAEELVGIVDETEQPILMATYTTATSGALAAFAEVGIPAYTSMPSCARAIKALADYGRFRERAARRAAPVETTASVRNTVGKALAESGKVLTEVQAKTRCCPRRGVFLRYPEFLATGEDDASEAAMRISGPIALKVQSPNIVHKTEAGAVLLGLTGDAAVREGYRAVLARAKAAHPGAKIDGVLVQAMAKRGQEMILGITRDPVFEPVFSWSGSAASAPSRLLKRCSTFAPGAAR